MAFDRAKRQALIQQYADGPARLGAALAKSALRGVAKRIDYTEIGGALLAGVTKPAVIAHGRSDATAIASAIRGACSFAERALPDQLSRALAALA